MRIVKTILLVGLAVFSFWGGYSFAICVDPIEEIASFLFQLLFALADLCVLLFVDNKEIKIERKKAREFESDKELFNEILAVIPESVMQELSAACPDAAINDCYLRPLWTLEETYDPYVMKSFHNQRIQKEYKKLCESVKNLNSFTSVNLFPCSPSGNLSLRQGHENGIENNRLEVEKISKKCYYLIDQVVADYRSFLETGKDYFGC